MNRLMEKTVFSGLVTAWRLATWPTSRSSALVNATTDGVSLLPSGLVTTVGSLPPWTATTEFVVPKSMPMILLMRFCPRGPRVAGPNLAAALRARPSINLTCSELLKCELPNVKSWTRPPGGEDPAPALHAGGRFADKNVVEASRLRNRPCTIRSRTALSGNNLWPRRKRRRRPSGPRVGRPSSGSSRRPRCSAPPAGPSSAYSPRPADHVELDDYTPGTITRVHARGGELVGEFTTERRVILEYEDIPEVLRHAIIAAEDGDFSATSGSTFPASRSRWAENILSGNLTGAGASTLTMQLARNITLGRRAARPREDLQRKLARRTTRSISRSATRSARSSRSTCNQIWLGTAQHAAHGVEAASQLYFGKSVGDLALEEAALIAGILLLALAAEPAGERRARPQSAQLRAPAHGRRGLRHPDRGPTRPRRGRSSWLNGSSEPIRSRPTSSRRCASTWRPSTGRSGCTRTGWWSTRRSTAGCRRAANRAVSDGLRRLDKRHGFRPVARNVLAEGGTLQDYRHGRWQLVMAADDIVPAVVTAVSDSRIGVRFGNYDAAIGRDGFEWIRPLARGAPRGGRSRDGPHRRHRPRRRHGRGHPGPGARGRGGAHRAREPHRPHPRDGRRLQLRSQQVQPGDAGLPAARLAVQGHPLRCGDRPGLHGHVARRR